MIQFLFLECVAIGRFTLASNMHSLFSYGLALLAASQALAAPAPGHHGSAKKSHCSTATSILSTSTSAPSSTSSSSAVTTTTVNTQEYPTSTAIATATGTKGLNDYAKAAGKVYFGTAADIPGTAELSDVAYMTQLNNTHDFGQLTPANYMKVDISPI